MDIQGFELVLEKAKQCEYYDPAEGKSTAVIKHAEELLGLSFSPQLNYYLSHIGYLSFAGNEFLGILKDDFNGTPAMNIVEFALQQRAQFDLPKSWIPIYIMGDGSIAFLDSSRCNTEGEPPVILGLYSGTAFVDQGVIAEDYGDFMEQRINQQLSRQ